MDGAREYLPLPGPVDDPRPEFHRRLAEVLGLVGGELPAPPGPDRLDRYIWENKARTSVVRAVSDLKIWPDPVVDATIRAIVCDPDPSFNRQLISPTLDTAGHRRVQTALLDLLDGGTDAEKAGAARAWYWTTAAPLRTDREPGAAARARHEALRARYELAEDLRIRWQATLLRVFVGNEDLDVRRSVLPGLSLKPADHPAEHADLVARAVHIARSHPDEYLRHRVEHQI